jgi:hypothetical protein
VDRLAKICGLLASDHDGERAAAAAKASQLLRAAGLSWRDLIECGCPKAPRQASPDWRQTDHRPRVARLLARGHLSAWEAEFLRSIAKRPALSAKQAAVLAKIERDQAA